MVGEGSRSEPLAVVQLDLLYLVLMAAAPTTGLARSRRNGQGRGPTGSGRIGRSFVRAAVAQPGTVDVVAVNDTNDPEMLAYLLEHDTVQGPISVSVGLAPGVLLVGADRLSLTHEPRAGEAAVERPRRRRRRGGDGTVHDARTRPPAISPPARSG